MGWHGMGGVGRGGAAWNDMVWFDMGRYVTGTHVGLGGVVQGEAGRCGVGSPFHPISIPSHPTP